MWNFGRHVLDHELQRTRGGSATNPFAARDAANVNATMPVATTGWLGASPFALRPAIGFDSLRDPSRAVRSEPCDFCIRDHGRASASFCFAALASVRGSRSGRLVLDLSNSFWRWSV